MKKFISIAWLSLLSLLGHAQMFVINEDFDGDTIPLLPAMWETTTVSGIGFRTEDGNNSDNPGASGLNNVVIRNTDSSGVYSLISPVFSTTGFNNIKLLFTSRISNNFLSSGSTVPLIECSTDNGQSWSALTYTDNDANSIWSVVNDSVPIALPASADNTPSVKLRWTVSIVNASSGSYRIDDVKVSGDPITANFENLETPMSSVYPNPCSQNLNIISSDRINSIEILDYQGQTVLRHSCNSSRFSLDTSGLGSGLYVVRLLMSHSMERLNLIVQ